MTSFTNPSASGSNALMHSRSVMGGVPVQAKQGRLQFVGCPFQVLDRGAIVGGLQLNAYECPALLHSNVSIRPDAGEWGQHQVALVAPEANAPLNRAKLQGGDVTFVVVVPPFCYVERVAFTDAVPNGPCPFNPLVIG